jgi:predicted nuclease with TOPRIM domain
MAENLNIPQPDPSWDYYLAWHSLQFVKSKIENALVVMTNQEFGTFSCDTEIKELLEPARDKLTEIIDEELNFVEDDEETA